MSEWIFWIIAGLWLLESIASMANASLFPYLMRRQNRKWSGIEADQQERVAVIVPVKGHDSESGPRFFDALLHQDYPNYRVILAVESAEDEVVGFLQKVYGISPDGASWRPEEGLSEGLIEVRLVVAGTCAESGQKVHNQLAACQLLNEGDRVIAFGDADILCQQDWLSKLVAPINAGTHSLSTTYRWLIPVRPTLPNLFASVINASVATAGQETWSTLWGGSMAMSRKDFDELDVPGLLRGSLNDDLRINKVAHSRGYRVAFVRSLMMPSPVDHNWATFFEFANRQYYQVRWFSPIIYCCALFLTWVYTLGFLSTVIAVFGYDYAPAVPVLVIAMLTDMSRGWARASVYEALYGDEKIVEALAKTRWIDVWMTPFWMMMHCALATSALFTRKIRWAGIGYRVRGVNRTEVLNRD